MTVKFDKLAESLGLDADVKEQITEAWQVKLKEARQEIAAELREEFAQKFEHDKTTLIKSMDSFLSEKVAAEIKEFAQDKQAAAAERVKYKTQVREHLAMMDKFMAESLSKEVRELREDRERSVGNIQALEKFVLGQLTEEVRDLRRDKQALVEQRVKLVRESKTQLNETRAQFIKRSAAIIEENLNKIIQKEIRQYRSDIERARENDFGRRMFEAFAGEFMASHLNEASDVKKMLAQVQQLSTQLEESKAELEQKNSLLENAQLKIRAAQDLVGREKVLSELMSPLGKQQRVIMGELLENVKTKDLRESFKKYLPSLLNEKAMPHTRKRPLREGTRTEVTGDRKVTMEQQGREAEDQLEINQLRKLAGISQ